MVIVGAASVSRVRTKRPLSGLLLKEYFMEHRSREMSFAALLFAAARGGVHVTF
jgi:hypothetical protein